MTLKGFIDCRLGIQSDVLHCSAKITQIFRKKNPRFSIVLRKQPYLTDQSVHASSSREVCDIRWHAYLLYSLLCERILSSSALTLLVGWHGRQLACKNWMLVCWCDDVTGALHIVEFWSALTPPTSSAAAKPRMLWHSGTGCPWLSCNTGH